MEYLLTMKIRFEAMDDVEARQKAHEIDMGDDPSNYAEITGSEVKLQRLKKDGAPEKVNF